MAVSTVLSAIMPLVVPRAVPVVITRWMFAGVRVLFRLRGSRARSFEARDRDLACTAAQPVRPGPDLAGADGTGYMLLHWSLGERPPRTALLLSGSSIYTLGFEVPRTCRPPCWPSPRPGSGWCCWPC
jgi:hypothetical protein